MVGQTKSVQQIIERSSHQVLGQVTNDYDIFTVVLMKQAIEVILEE